MNFSSKFWTKFAQLLSIFQGMIENEWISAYIGHL